MFIPHPFFMASSSEFGSKSYRRKKNGLLLVDEVPIRTFHHKPELEWVMDISEYNGYNNYHVENVTIKEPDEPRIFSCNFAFRAWGHNHSDWLKCMSKEQDYINFVLSLRIYGFLIDAWEFKDAVVCNQHSIDNSTLVRLHISQAHIQPLPRVDLQFSVARLSKSIVRGRYISNDKELVFHANLPDSIPITPRQLLFNSAKQRTYNPVVVSLNSTNEIEFT